MAIVFGKLERKSMKQDLITLGLLLTVPFIVVSMLFDPKGDTVTELTTVGTVGAALTMLLVFVYARINPLPMQRLFRREAYERNLSINTRVVHNLEQLDDSFYVFNNFIFELCGVEHLVVSRDGIFVITKVKRSGEIRVRNKVLFVDDTPLETLTSTTWRICHLINIILRKWFNTDYMPQPVLIVDQKNPPKLKEFDGISIVASDDLNGLVRDRGQEIKAEIAYGFAKFVRERYVTYK